MGNLQYVNREEQNERKRSVLLENQLHNDNHRNKKTMRILVLGTGSSGKRAVLKQMVNLYGRRPVYSATDAALIHRSVLTNMHALLRACEQFSPISWENSSLSEEILRLDPNVDGIDGAVGDMLERVWRDVGVQETWSNRGSFQVQESLEYYMDKINVISSVGYVPDDLDMLRARIRTTGAVTETFDVEGIKIEMYDIGGQRNERRKWLHAFSNVHAILYVVAADEYDEVLFEDYRKSRQEESLSEFKRVVDNEAFREIPFILFLNKWDLFLDKLQRIPFRVADGPNSRNTSFEGPYCIPGTESSLVGTPEFEECAEAAGAYTESLYTNLFYGSNGRVRGGINELYVHRTCALDSNNMNLVFNALRDIILKSVLSKQGFTKEK